MSEADYTTATKAAVTRESLLGDWHVLSAVVPVSPSVSADVAWQGTMMEFSPHSVRFHRHDLTLTGETTDTTISTYSATYGDNGIITINAVPLTVSRNEDGTLAVRGSEVELTISHSSNGGK